jgi:hypothetical protein
MSGVLLNFQNKHEYDFHLVRQNVQSMRTMNNNSEPAPPGWIVDNRIPDGAKRLEHNSSVFLLHQSTAWSMSELPQGGIIRILLTAATLLATTVCSKLGLYTRTSSLSHLFDVTR